MKIKVEVELDYETGQYELEFKNLTNPGEGIEYTTLMKGLRKVFGDFASNFEITEEADKEMVN